MRQTILTIILVILISATIYVWYAYLRTPEDVGGPAVGSVEDERLVQYRKLKDLKPDTNVFSDPLFQLLNRYRPPNVPPMQPPGRANPFSAF